MGRKKLSACRKRSAKQMNEVMKYVSIYQYYINLRTFFADTPLGSNIYDLHSCLFAYI